MRPKGYAAHTPEAFRGGGRGKAVCRRPPPRNRAPGGGNRGPLLQGCDFFSVITFEHFLGLALASGSAARSGEATPTGLFFSPLPSPFPSPSSFPSFFFSLLFYSSLSAASTLRLRSVHDVAHTV